MDASKSGFGHFRGMVHRASILGAAASSLSALTSLCDSCGTQPTSLLLAALGGIWYLTLLGLSFLESRIRWVANALLLSVTVHSGLLITLLLQHRLCWSCLAAGIAAVTAAFVAEFTVAQRRTIGVYMGLGLALGVFYHVVAAPFPELESRQPERPMLELVRPFLAESDPAILMLTRSDCPVCTTFLEHDWPTIRTKLSRPIGFRSLPVDHGSAVKVVPTFVIVRRGMVEGFIEGAVPRERLLAVLNHALWR